MAQEIVKTPEDKLRVKIDEMRDDSKDQLRSLRTGWVDSVRDYRPQSSQHNQRDGVGHNKLQKKRAGNDLLENGSGSRIASIIDQKISMIYANNPTATFLPREQEDFTFATELESLTKWRLEKIDLREKLINGGLYSHLFGWQAMHVYWDDSLPNEPDVNVRVLWPESIIIDPKLQTQNPMEGDFVGYDRLINVDYAKRKWPKKAKRIEEEMEKVRSGTFSTVISGGNDHSDMLARVLGHVTKGATNETNIDRDNQVLMTVIWFKDYSQTTIEDKQPLKELIETGQIVEQEVTNKHIWAETGELVTEENIPVVKHKVPTYPYGRHVIKIGNIILEDYAWGFDPETNDVRQRSWPIAIAVNKLIPGAWFGQDECEALRADQNIHDVMLQAITEHAYSSARPVREVDTTKTLSDKGKLLSQLHDGIVPTKGKNALTTHNPGQMSNDAYNLLKLSETNMEITAGTPGQSIGRQGSSEQTATEIAALQRASQGKSGITSVHVDGLVNKVYMLSAETIQFEYDEGKIIRVLGDSTDSQMTSINITQRLKSIAFDVKVESGSTLPNDKQQKKVEAQELFSTVGLPMLPQLLEAYGVKNKDGVLKEHQEYQMFIQFGPLLQDPVVQQFLQEYAANLEAQQGQQQGQPKQVAQ